MSRFEKLDDYTKAATKIQSTVRGNQTRNQYKKNIEEFKKDAKVLETYRSDKYLIDQLGVELKKLKLTLDKFYRICDDTMKKRITTKQFMDQITSLGINYSTETKKRLALIFDEDFNESITYKEFIETCEAFGAELPIDLPADYVSVSKRALQKMVKMMKKKGIKAEHMFMMKDSAEVSIEDFKTFLNNTLSVNLKKREEHALFVLCDSNKSNSINKDEFVILYGKGEKLLNAPPAAPMKNNFLDGNIDKKDTVTDNKGGSNKKKSNLNRADSSIAYSGDVKSELVKIIHKSDFVSIEEYFSSACKWNEKDFVSYDKFVQKANQLFPSIPESDLQEFYDELDVSGKGKVKVSNMVKELKNEVAKAGDDTLSLLTLKDINPRSGDMTPRSSSTFYKKEINDHCENQGCKLEEIFRVAKGVGKAYITKADFRESLRKFLPKLSRNLIDSTISDFKEDKITYTEYLVYFDVKEAKKKTEESIEKAQQKWIKKYCEA